jgi:ABC-type multidrug transport system fused ATPase/permease subunit
MSGILTHAAHYIAALVALVVAGVVFIGRTIQAFLHEQAQTKRINQELDRAKAETQAAPEKSKPAWDLARATLENYFNRNLFQISSIFLLSVGVMLVGFAIVAVGISLAIQHPDTKNAISPSSIATISGIITQFIGATFLFIYRSTIQQAINYSRMLERINSVGMAMQILDTMPDATTPEDLKSNTKALLVELLVRQVYVPGSEDALPEIKQRPDQIKPQNIAR